MNFDSGIQWTDITTNPLRFRDADGRDVWACVKVSPGCANCYSAGIAERFKRGGKYNLNVMQGLTPYLDAAELGRILRSKRAAGKRCFPFDMTDLFGPWVPDELIAACFGVFAARPDITFQILTKHPERAVNWFEWAKSPRGCAVSDWCIHVASGLVERLPSPGMVPPPWPLPNVWIGASVEDQPRADERIPHLLRVPAAVRFLSVEPQLGPVNLAAYLPPARGTCGTTESPCDHSLAHDRAAVHWVIVGGESGPSARPFDLAWPASLSEQCAGAGVPYFFKQGGARCIVGDDRIDLASKKGGDIDELARRVPWLADRGVFRREWPPVEAAR